MLVVRKMRLGFEVEEVYDRSNMTGIRWFLSFIQSPYHSCEDKLDTTMALSAIFAELSISNTKCRSIPDGCEVNQNKC